jgi:hypothetical protein
MGLIFALGNHDLSLFGNAKLGQGDKDRSTRWPRDLNAIDLFLITFVERDACDINAKF